MSLLQELLDDAVDSEGNPIPLESPEARFIIENFFSVRDLEDDPNPLVENAKVSEVFAQSNCGIGAGGFKKGNRCALGGRRSKSTSKGSPALVDTKRNAKGKLTLKNGDPLPKHIPSKVHGWNQVKISIDPNAKLYAKGVDSKGRGQSAYHPSHSITQAAKKFAKTNELRKKNAQIVNELKRDLKNPATKEPALVLALIHHTGIRPGSDKDTKAEKQAYGATTLRAKHISKDGTRLKFTGKKGVSLDIKVTDPTIAKALADRKKSKGPNDKVFEVNDSALREYTKTKDGGGFNPKDFRTAKGTETAIEAMRDFKVPSNEKEYKKYVKLVAEKVAEKLGNTPTVALQSYIDPSVFTSWRPK